MVKLIPGSRPVPFGHLGDGNIHYNVSQPIGGNTADFMSRWHEVNEVVFAIVLRMGGSISAEHGIGVLKRDELPDVKDKVAIELMRGIKAMLDPAGHHEPGQGVVTATSDKAASALAIAPIADADVATVIALWQACGLTRPWNDPAADIALARRGPNSTILIGRADNNIVATAMVGHDGHRGWVYYVATDPDRRAKGFGRAIMDAAEDWLRAAGIAKLQLLVRPENARAGAFYQSIGYGEAADALFSPNGSTAASRRRDEPKEFHDHLRSCPCQERQRALGPALSVERGRVRVPP